LTSSSHIALKYHYFSKQPKDKHTFVNSWHEFRTSCYKSGQTVAHIYKMKLTLVLPSFVHFHKSFSWWWPYWL